MSNPVSLPDHPVRQTRWYQLFHRLPRGLAMWVGVAGFGWAMFGCDLAGVAMSEGLRLTVGGLGLTPLGMKVIESVRGVS